MKVRIVMCSIVAASLVLLGTQVFPQSNPGIGGLNNPPISLAGAPANSQVRNSGNPPAFRGVAAPVSARLAFLASEKGKQMLLRSASPMARSALMRYHGAEAAAEWDNIPHNYRDTASTSGASPMPRRQATPAAITTVSRCPATRFNLEPAAGALPQNEESVDFKYGGGSTTATDMVAEASNDFRGFLDAPAVFSPSASGYYVVRSAGCTPDFEGGLPPMPDPLAPATRMWGGGDPIINYDSNHDSWFYSSSYFDEYSDGVAVFRNTTSKLKDTIACPSGTHNMFASISCWPLGPASSGFNAMLVDRQSEPYYLEDKPDSWVDSRTSGTGAGDVYVSDTVIDLEHGISWIDLSVCTNDLTKCSGPITISPTSDTSATFSDVKTKSNGNISITYGNYSTFNLPGPLYTHINIVDIKYVVCTPNGAPAQPTCSAPTLAATEYQPVTELAGLNDVRNNTYPVHIERVGVYPIVFWERCASLSDLPFGGDTPYGGATCPDADIVGVYSVDGGTTWVAPFAVDTSYGHQIQPWVTYDAALDVINIVYQNCNSTFKNQCQVGFRQIPSGSATPGAFKALSSYASPEAEANRGYFQPLFGDHIGASARGPGGASSSHLWIGYTDTLRSGTYGFGTESDNESNNNIVAIDYSNAAP